MNPFYFGASAEALYGVLHAAPAGRPARTGVVICAAARDEYTPSHRALCRLAARLAQEGMPTLRFDYYGTGDSYGNDAEGTLARWRRDVGLAVEEVRDMAEVSRVTLVGIRLGGTVAALAASGRDDVESVVLWDPVVNGRTYLAELRERHHDLVAHVLGLGGDAEGDGLCGFPLTDAFLTELNALDLCAAEFPPVRMFLLCSEERADYADLARAAWNRGAAVERALVPAQRIWEEKVLWSNQLVPVRSLERIVSWLR